MQLDRRHGEATVVVHVKILIRAIETKRHTNGNGINNLGTQ